MGPNASRNFVSVIKTPFEQQAIEKDMTPTSTTGPSMDNQTQLSPKLPIQLLECFLLPAAVIIPLAVMLCASWRWWKKRGAAKALPLLMQTAPSTEPDVEAMNAVRLGSGRVNARKCNGSLTVPIRTDVVSKRMKPVQMPETPRLRGVEGGNLSVLDLNSPSV